MVGWTDKDIWADSLLFCLLCWFCHWLPSTEYSPQELSTMFIFLLPFPKDTRKILFRTLLNLYPVIHMCGNIAKVICLQQSLLIYSSKDYLNCSNVNNKKKIINDMSSNTLCLECLPYKDKCRWSLTYLGTKIKSPKKIHLIKANYH